MAEKMFLIEVMVSEITCDPTYVDVIEPQDMTIVITFSDLMHSEIVVHEYPNQDFKTNEEKWSVFLNIGKTFLFYSKTHSLIAKLKQYPLEFVLKVKRNAIGSCKLPWSADYVNMINLFESIGFVKSVDFTGNIDLNDNKGNKIGAFDTYVRMTCCGLSMETEIILPKDEGVDPIFVSCVTQNRIFCKGYNHLETNILPATVCYKPVIKKLPGDFFTLGETHEPPVIALGSNTEAGLTGMFTNQDNLDVISISFAPDDSRLYDFLSTLNEKQKAEGKDNDKEALEREVRLQMSRPVVEQQLCKYLQCPGLKKFKEYGIGPLVKEKEYLEPKAPYTLSHANGRIENYGPEGKFIRPKKSNLPFVPPKNDFDKIDIKNQNICKCNCRCAALKGGDQYVGCLRLRGGVSYSDDYQGFKSPFEECKSVMDQFDEILTAYKKALGPCGETTCPFAANIVEESCKKICDVGDKVPEPETISCQSYPCNINECPYAEKKQYPAGCGSPKCAYTKYKLGLVDDDAAIELQFLPPAISGKCGHPKCEYPFQNPLPPIHWDCPDPLPTGPCKNINCPFQPPDLQKLKLKQPTGPCGSPVCPYAIPEPCDLPSCPFRRNPCPYLEQEKKGPAVKPCCSIESEDSACCEDPNFKGKFGDTVETCENPDCPARRNRKKSVTICDVPCRDTEPCDNPECPARKARQSNDVCDNPDCPARKFQKSNDICDNPDCPARKAQKSNDVCDNPDCPARKAQKSNDICDNPDCPARKAQKSNDVCDNPDCPARKAQKPNDVCDNPDCPARKAQKSNDICDNPDCPARRFQKSNDVCDNPDCPAKRTQKSDDICDNPDCPARKSQRSSDICENPDCPARKAQNSREICDNPDCPFNREEEEEIICENPNCPKRAKLQKAQDICDNPNCPAKQQIKKKKKVCGNPNCPFASSSTSEEEKCPKVLATCKNGEVCDNPNCPYQKPIYDPICTDPFCPYIQALPSCGIPGCPFEPKPLVYCPSPSCPSKFPRERRSSRTSSSGSAQKQQPEETIKPQEAAPPSPPPPPPPVDTKPSKISKMSKASKKSKTPSSGETLQSVSEEQAAKPVKPKSEKTKRKGGSKFVYSVGDRYPGVKIGHRECINPYFKVPPGMGWLWNIPWPRCYRLKPRRGWRPGAIQKIIAARIRAHRQAQGLGMVAVPTFTKARGGIVDSEEDFIKVVPRPTLKIQKKDGDYWITMNPLKDPKTLAQNEDPYMDCTPMKFRISKNRNRDQGDEDEEGCVCEDEENSSSSDSELDIEFTPPAGIIHPERFVKKKNVIHCDTQYDPKDFVQKKKDKKGKGGKGSKGGGKGSKGGGKGSKGGTKAPGSKGGSRGGKRDKK